MFKMRPHARENIYNYLKMLAPYQSPLEQMPMEIVQDIFFLTDMDPNMPQASFLLSRALSNKYVFGKFCRKAFQKHSIKNSWERHRYLQDHIKLQDDLFAMRWMTWGFFEWFLSQRRDRHFMTQAREAPEDVARGAAIKITDIATYPPWTPTIVCSIPDKLLRGPFTRDKLDFLRCLLSISKASIDWANSASVRLSALAKRQAIMDHNLDAVHLFSRVRRLAKSPDLVLVKFAVFEGGCNRSIVFELMVAGRSWGHRRWEDTELDAWVVRETAVGNHKAKWLGVKLVELRSGLYPDAESADYVLGEDKLVVKSSGDFNAGLGSRFKLA